MTGADFPGLTVWQPWAELIISGRKPLEIRTWQPSYRGRIWIHAGKHVDEALEAHFGLRELYRGGFIGSAELTSIEPIDERRWEAWRQLHHNASPCRPGLFAWVLASARRLAWPVPASGDRGLFQVSPELAAELMAADRAAAAGQ